ncbi:MAG: sigma-70 family RNA polymerase sigma factor [Bacillota bacterium]|nr:sigma-70 family RNA polymerase sigma factor [Bacillota bacterium]
MKGVVPPSNHSAEIQKVIEKYSSNIVRLAFAYVKNLADAEDIAQDVFFTYMTRCPTVCSEEHRKAWLYRVTMNRCKDLLKSGWKKRVTVSLPEELEHVPKEYGDILQAVFTLHTKYRTPIYLYYVEEYTVNEIAALLQANPSTVRTWLERGRRELKEKLGDEISE